jgi:hypothetical protein
VRECVKENPSYDIGSRVTKLVSRRRPVHTDIQMNQLNLRRIILPVTNTFFKTVIEYDIQYDIDLISLSFPFDFDTIPFHSIRYRFDLEDKTDR